MPGYLIAFCARLDEAKLIVGKHTKNEMEYPKAWYHRYFFWIMVAYAIGLVLAFTAFCITGVGQPALLYLVPCCLGMILILGRKEIRDLWSGSRAIRLATKVKTKCERAWGKEKMRRQVAKLKRERGENGVTQPYRASRSGFREPDPPVDTGNHGLQGGRGNREGGRGRGRGGRSAGRGRGLEKGRGSKGPSGISGRDALRTSSPKRAPKESAPVKESETLKSPTRSKSKTSPPANSPASPRRKYQASLEGTPSPKKGSSKKIAKKNTLPPKPDLGDEDELRGPKGNDVCFRDSKCTGTKHLRTIVKHELKSDPQAEFSPILLNRILQRLDGRDFYVPDKNGGLKEASKNEITKEISKLFHSEKSKLQEKNAKSKLRNGGDEE